MYRFLLYGILGLRSVTKQVFFPMPSTVSSKQFISSVKELDFRCPMLSLFVFIEKAKSSQICSILTGLAFLQ